MRSPKARTKPKPAGKEVKSRASRFPLGLADAELVLEGAGVDLVGGDVEAEQGRSGVEDSRRVVKGAGGLVGERGEGAGHPGGALADVEALVVGLSGAPGGSPGASGHEEKDRDRS
jgi:hypothetical protein